MGPHDEPCRACSKPVGDHLVRDLAVCTRGHDLTYEEIPERMEFTLAGRDTVMADHITARALTADLPWGAAPVLLLTFETMLPARAEGEQPRLVQAAEVGLILDPGAMRKAGTLVRDTAFGAANRAEGRR